jgi:hypothetical protein
MKNLYESILDIDDTMDNMENTALDAVGVEWVQKHIYGVGNKTLVLTGPQKVQTNKGDITLDRCYDFEWQSSGRYAMYEINAKDKNFPEKLPQIKYIHKVQISGFKGEEFPKNLLPYQFDILIIRDCPNLKTLPPMQKKVLIFSVMDCPKFKDTSAFPEEVIDIFKWLDNGVEIKKNKMNKYLKNTPQKIII